MTHIWKIFKKFCKICFPPQKNWTPSPRKIFDFSDYIAFFYKAPFRDFWLWTCSLYPPLTCKNLIQNVDKIGNTCNKFYSYFSKNRRIYFLVCLFVVLRRTVWDGFHRFLFHHNCFLLRELFDHHGLSFLPADIFA